MCAREREQESKREQGEERERACASERERLRRTVSIKFNATSGHCYGRICNSPPEPERRPPRVCVCVCVCVHMCAASFSHETGVCIRAVTFFFKKTPLPKDSLTIVSVVTQRETNEISRISHTKLVDPLTLSRLSPPPPSSES